jgi:uncharacterized membrane protein YphA (DoxX/SURF4 family)
MNKTKVTGIHFVPLRITLGLIYLETWWFNFSVGVFTTENYINVVEDYTSRNIYNPFNYMAETVILPNADLFLLLQILAEFIIAVSLIFGIFCRFGSLFGAFMSVNLLLLTLGADWYWSYILMIVGFITCAIVGAGRWWGIDYILKSKLPPKISKYLI